VLHIVKRGLKVAVLALALLYLGDFLSVRFQIPHRELLEPVEVQTFYQVRLKGKKVEYMKADSQTETCVHSLFPQIGYTPCWYLMSHRQKWVEIGALRPALLSLVRLAEPVARVGDGVLSVGLNRDFEQVAGALRRRFQVGNHLLVGVDLFGNPQRQVSLPDILQAG